MQMDRNANLEGKGKYALVRLRNITTDDEAHGLLRRLEELGHLDWGLRGAADEFFVIKLKDKFAAPALDAYADAAESDDLTWACQVRGIAVRASERADKKMPD